MNDHIKFYTVSEVSKLLRVNRNKVYKLIHSGELQAFDFGILKIEESEIRKFISSRTTASSSETVERR